MSNLNYCCFEIKEKWINKNFQGKAQSADHLLELIVKKTVYFAVKAKNHLENVVF